MRSIALLAVSFWSSTVCLVPLGAPVAAEENVDITPDVVYGHKLGLAMTMDVFQPQNANGAGALFMVSGGWNSRWHPPQQARALFNPLLDKGFTVFAVRHGSAPTFKIPEIVSDVRRSVRFVRANAERFGVDPERLGVCGGSAGGHLSLMLGTTADDGHSDDRDPIQQASARVAAVVAYFPPTDLRPYVNPESPYYTNFPALQFDAELADDFSPVLHASQDDPPILLIHGDQDQLVKLDHSTNMVEACRKAGVPCELIVIEGAAHGFTGDDAKRAADAWVAFFEKHLLGP